MNVVRSVAQKLFLLGYALFRMFLFFLVPLYNFRLLVELVNDTSEMTDEMRRKVLERLDE